MNSEIQIVESNIQMGDWSDRLSDHDTGAHAWFAGVTRRTTAADDGAIQITKSLFYEAHHTMAMSELSKIADEAIERYSLKKVVVVHRIGEVPLGEASVLVGCSSAHRKDSFAALPWIMDRLKQDVPIWKRETFHDDSTEWVHPDSK